MQKHVHGLRRTVRPARAGPGQIPTGSTKIKIEDPDTRTWLTRMAEKGWTAPMWPKAYGGGGLTKEQYVVLIEEMRRIEARTPLMGMGTSMIGPTLLELGTEDQKRRHIPPIVRGELGWCQGYSEPSAGSDLASLRTRAEDRGDHFLINGQKIWTSGAQYADWMFALVRTNPDVPKHEGISFVLLTMDQPGVTVKPIRLISGTSPFCETFFDNAIARKEDLVGEVNKGWTVGKRLLQHERSGMSALVGGGPRDAGPSRHRSGENLCRFARRQTRRSGAAHRSHPSQHELARVPAHATAHGRRIERRQNAGPRDVDLQDVRHRAAAGTFGAAREAARLQRHRAGAATDFAEDEIEGMRTFLGERAASIYSGSNEIQRNIIAKRVLGLPD